MLSGSSLFYGYYSLGVGVYLISYKTSFHQSDGLVGVLTLAEWSSSSLCSSLAEFDGLSIDIILSGRRSIHSSISWHDGLKMVTNKTMFLSVSHKPDTKDSKYNLLTVSIKQDVSCNLMIR